MKVILPGSYDPITLGHLALIQYASEKYSEVYVVAFINPAKEYTFSKEDRLEMLSIATADIPNVKVDFCDGYVVDYMRQHGIEKIIKGYRNEKDFEYERLQADYNLQNGGYETELYRCTEALSGISSTMAREALRTGKSLAGILPESVIEYAKSRFVALSGEKT